MVLNSGWPILAGFEGRGFDFSLGLNLTRHDPSHRRQKWQRNPQHFTPVLKYGMNGKDHLNSTSRRSVAIRRLGVQFVPSASLSFVSQTLPKIGPLFSSCCKLLFPRPQGIDLFANCLRSTPTSGVIAYHHRPISRTINRSEKRVRNPCRFNSSKNTPLKPPVESTDPKKGGVGWCARYKSRNILSARSEFLAPVESL
jgi:hypothetical protein